MGQDQTVYEIKQDLEKLGLDTSPGCRIGLMEEVLEIYGIDWKEIVGKLSDDDIVRAVDTSLQYAGVYADQDDDDGEDNN